MAESPLGSPLGRVKTDIRMPAQLASQIERACEHLGIPKNAFFVLSTGLLLMELMPLFEENKKRMVAVLELCEYFQKIMDQARANA